MSASAPWLKFYPRDWRGDQALRAVSMAARGFWMECLCIMHEASPRGHLLLNGKPIGDDALARMTGATEDQVRTWMSELRVAGVLSTARNGIIYSRRMVSDDAASKKGAKAVARRWAQDPDKPPQSGGPIRGPTSPPNTQKPETRSQIPESSTQCVEGTRDGEAIDHRSLEHELRMAVGLERRVRINTGLFVSLIEAGCDLHLDILPTIKGKITDRIRTLDYFAEAIAEARDRRLSAGSSTGSVVTPLRRWQADQAAQIEALKQRKPHA